MTINSFALARNIILFHLTNDLNCRKLTATSYNFVYDKIQRIYNIHIEKREVKLYLLLIRTVYCRYSPFSPNGISPRHSAVKLISADL